MRRHLANLRGRYGVTSGPELAYLLFPESPEAALSLTGREREIFHLARSGLSSRQIGLRLGISFSTVRRHRENMLLKNECASMRELVARSLNFQAGGD